MGTALFRHLVRRISSGLAALALALVASAGSARAQAGPRDPASFVRRDVDQDAGLPETQVNAIAQGPDGYFWLGTRLGLVRYDGTSFTTIGPDQVPALPTGWVNALQFDRGGRLWISTASGLVVREGTSFRRIPPDQVAAAETWKVLQDRRGTYWVTSKAGLFTGDGRTFRQVPGVPGRLYAVTEDSSGTLWFAGRNYLATLGPGDAAPVPAALGDDEWFFDVIPDEQGGVWVGTRHGAWRLVRNGHAAVRVVERVADKGHRENQVWSLARTPRGNLWLGTEMQGVLRWDGHAVTHLMEGPVQVPEVWSLFVDQRGRVWAGTGTGLVQFHRSPFTTLTEPVTRSTWTVRGAHGRVYAATSDGAVASLVGTRLRQVVPPAPRSFASAIWPLAEGPLLVVHNGRRILQVAPEGTADITSRFALPPTDVVGAWQDRDRSVWFTTDSGVYRSTGGPVRRMDAMLGVRRGERPRIIDRDAAGRLVLGDPGVTIVEPAGPVRLGPNEGLQDTTVMTVLPDSAQLWVGTADSGLYVVRGHRATHLGHLHPALRREILGIVADLEGYLWLSSSYGLVRVSRADLLAAARGGPQRADVRRFDRADGLPTTEFNGDFEPQVYRDAEGMLWLPSFGGVVRVNPREVAADTVPPQVHLEQLVVDGRVAALARRVRLPQHASRVEFTFAATNALVPARSRVEYRLLGLDTAWTPAGSRRTVSFGPLRGGQYRFEVRAAGEDGAWSPAPAVVELDVARTLTEHAWFLPGVLGLTALLALGIARWRQRRLVRRGHQLAALVEERTRDLEAARASLEQRVEERTSQLHAELDERKRLEQQLVQSQKLESMGRLAGGVAHEINNSITSVLGFAELAERAASGRPDLVADLREVRSAGQRVAEITGQLLAFARRQHTTASSVHLQPLLTHLGRQLLQATGPTVRIDLRVPEDLPAVRADSAQVEQLTINLVRNARDAMPAGGIITISGREAALAVPQSVGDALLRAGRYVVMEVADTGSGMDAEVRARLFEPFFTTKAVNRGTGLGLAVCHGIVSRHGGAIEVDSAPGEGTRIRVWWPVWTGESVKPGEAAPPTTGHETILLAEDESAVRQVVVRMLTLSGYEVIEAADGSEALTRFRDRQAAIDLVLTDVMMPELTGPDLVRLLRGMRPDLPVVFMSGYVGPDSPSLTDLASLGSMVTKPFTQDTLTLAVRAALDKAAEGRRAPGRYVG